MALGDFNNDGRQDIATANQSGTVSLLLGDGAGAFPTQATSLTAANAPEFVAAGDFNLDGNEDLAVSRSNASAVAIYLGNGNATFAAPSTLATGGGNPDGLAVGDLDSDGDEDIAIANMTNDVVLVRLGDGTGAFPTAATSSPIPAADDPNRISIGDANNDGRPDLYVASGGGSAVNHVLLGNGAGIFTEAPGSPSPGVAGGPALRLGDFNRDGHEDFAQVSAVGDNVTIQLGAGTGGFTAPQFVSVAGLGRGFALGDFNSDGVEDFAAMQTTVQKLAVRFGDGTGAFPGVPAGAPADIGPGASDAVVGDFNADGNADVAISSESTDAVTVRLGGGAPADSGNLLVNGGAEAAPGSTASRKFGAVTAIPGWTTTGPFSNHRYVAAESYPDRYDAARWQGQEAFFSIGATTGSSSATQTVNVSGSAALIDAGNAGATLRGYLGGFRAGDDTMQATATFKNAAGVSIGTPLQIGPVTPADRKSRTTLLRRSAEGAVPAGTRSITVTLAGTHGASAFQDAAYADRMTLLLADLSQPPGGGGDPPPGAANDVTPPETTITKAPKNKSSKAKAKYKFTSSEPNSTFACKFDRKPFKPCDAGKVKYKRLDYGKHKFKVRATDAAGNTDPSAARDKFKRR